MFEILAFLFQKPVSKLFITVSSVYILSVYCEMSVFLEILFPRRGEVADNVGPISVYPISLLYNI